jgi:diguanylate cyclase (GGDEF)-like protein
MRVPLIASLRPRSLRARFIVGLIVVIVLVAVNIGSFYWGARQRERVFEDLRTATLRHVILNEAKAELDDQYKRVKVVSDLLGVEGANLSPDEQDRITQSITSIQHRLASVASADPDPALERLGARVDSLADSWRSFYSKLQVDPAEALAEVVLEAEPLAELLLTVELPAVIRALHGKVQLATTAFERTDARSYRLVWTVLLVSVLLSAGLAASLSRDLLRAIGALKTGAERFAAAELDFRVKVENFDELADVGKSLNIMAHRLRTAHAELEVRNEELARLAFRDALTKLANRALFRERVEQSLRGGDGETHEIAVLFVDLDNFKAVNDSYGHSIGDRLLIEVAARLLHATRGCDTVARLGGDEFAILLDVQQSDEAVIVAERVVATFRKPFSLDDRVVHVGASIGVAWGRDGTGADEVLRNADVAMYTAKAKGKNRFELFAPAMHAALVDRAELEADLRSAVERNELYLEFQPIIELATQAVTGYEALARWRHPVRGQIAPGLFIPIAEECGAILGLGQWVLEEACREASAWQELLPTMSLSVNVNVSSRQLEQPAFFQHLTDLLRITGLDPHRLVLEITESEIMRDSAVNLDRLRQLKQLGVRLAIDDFGTGYSSLAYLQRFPVDIIKIDKAFVKSVAISGSDAALARTIIMLSETLGLLTVAEGIEYQDQHVMLQELGCELGQGYLFAYPLGTADVRAMLLAQASLPMEHRHALTWHHPPINREAASRLPQPGHRA